MPNTSAKLGQNAASLMASLLGGGGGAKSGAEGYAKGMEAGSQSRLRQAQGGKLAAETQKILEELQQAASARDISGSDIATAQGVSPEAAAAVTAGGRTMPAYVMQSGPTAEAISPEFVSKTQNANTLKLLQQLGGGNAQALAGALGSLQSQGTQGDLMSGARAPADVAPIMAAMKGADPTFATSSGAGRPSSKVQDMQFLMSSAGGGLAKKDAARQVFGDKGASMWLEAYTALIGKYYSPEEAALMATDAVEKVQSLGDPSAATAVPRNVVKVYK